MSKIKFSLFVGGLVLEVFAFLIGNASNLPWMHRLLSPAYYKAQKALIKLESEKELIQTDYGFQEIIRALQEKAIQERHPEISGLPVRKIVRGTPAMGFSANKAGVSTPVEFHFEGGRTVKWNLEEIVEKIQALRTKNLFCWALGLFAIGVILQVAGFLIENKKRLTTQSSGP